MDFLQTYETTIASSETGLSASFLVIPARSCLAVPLQERNSLNLVAEKLFDTTVRVSFPVPFMDLTGFADLLLGKGIHTPDDDWRDDTEYGEHLEGRSGRSSPSPDALQFSSYVLNARVIPFENSPLGAESLASIAASSVKAGTITLGATIGYIAAGPTAFLLVTVPLGIVLCGASVSFAKYMEENRKSIWKRLLQEKPKPTERRIKRHIEFE